MLFPHAQTVWKDQSCNWRLPIFDAVNWYTVLFDDICFQGYKITSVQCYTGY
jgi:hypothetical protein